MAAPERFIEHPVNDRVMKIAQEAFNQVSLDDSLFLLPCWDDYTVTHTLCNFTMHTSGILRRNSSI